LARSPQHLGGAAAGHRLWRLNHVAHQRDHEVGPMHPGERRPAAARPRRPAARAAPSLGAGPRPSPPDAFIATAARARGRRAARLGTGIDLEHRSGTIHAASVLAWIAARILGVVVACL